MRSIHPVTEDGYVLKLTKDDGVDYFMRMVEARFGRPPPGKCLLFSSCYGFGAQRMADGWKKPIIASGSELVKVDIDHNDEVRGYMVDRGFRLYRPGLQKPILLKRDGERIDYVDHKELYWIRENLHLFNK